MAYPLAFYIEISLFTLQQNLFHRTIQIVHMVASALFRLTMMLSSRAGLTRTTLFNQLALADLSYPHADYSSAG